VTSSIASSTLEGRLSLPLLYLAYTIADSARFRTVCSAADRNAALGHIYLGGVEEDEADNLPQCVIRHLNGSIAESVGTTDWNGTGPLRMFFILPHPSGASDWNDAYARVANDVGVILKETMTLSKEDPGAGPYLEITDIALTAFGQWDSDEENGDDNWEAEFVVTWRGM